MTPPDPHSNDSEGPEWSVGSAVPEQQPLPLLPPGPERQFGPYELVTPLGQGDD